MKQKPITITEYLTNNKVVFDEQGEELITSCPFCEKTAIGEHLMLVLHISPRSGDAQCWECGAVTTFIEVAKKFGLRDEIEGIDEGFIKFSNALKNTERATKEKEEEYQDVPEERVDTSQVKPMSSRELIDILGLTIKKDEENKIITFLCELSAYTENSQFNISFNAPSSTGKSFIPLEISGLFPPSDVMKLGNCSPTAFFHEQGKYDKEKNTILVDLSRKIIIFLDQPHNALLERLRSLLSHDEKEMQSKITDKSQKGGNRTKTVIIRGYPSVIFCSAGLRIDEQEATRFLLLSPEVSQEKIRQGISATIRKEADNERYRTWLEENPGRSLLKTRILGIKQAGIGEIRISQELEAKIEKKFMDSHKAVKPRHQRDIKRLISLIKAFALLNLWWRERKGSIIGVSEADVEDAFKLWDAISISQELNLPPYIYNLYNEVILPAWNERQLVGKGGINRQEVAQKHFDVYGRILNNIQLRQQILPMLETAGLIIQEADANDKRKILIYPTAQLNNSGTQNNSEVRGGVDNAQSILDKQFEGII